MTSVSNTYPRHPHYLHDIHHDFLPISKAYCSSLVIDLQSWNIQTEFRARNLQVNKNSLFGSDWIQSNCQMSELCTIESSNLSWYNGKTILSKLYCSDSILNCTYPPCKNSLELQCSKIRILMPTFSVQQCQQQACNVAYCSPEITHELVIKSVRPWNSIQCVVCKSYTMLERAWPRCNWHAPSFLALPPGKAFCVTL